MLLMSFLSGILSAPLSLSLVSLLHLSFLSDILSARYFVGTIIVITCVITAFGFCYYALPYTIRCWLCCCYGLGSRCFAIAVDTVDVISVVVVGIVGVVVVVVVVVVSVDVVVCDSGFDVVLCVFIVAIISMVVVVRVVIVVVLLLLCGCCCRRRVGMVVVIVCVFVICIVVGVRVWCSVVNVVLVVSAPKTKPRI